MKKREELEFKKSNWNELYIYMKIKTALSVMGFVWVFKFAPFAMVQFSICWFQRWFSAGIDLVTNWIYLQWMLRNLDVQKSSSPRKLNQFLKNNHRFHTNDVQRSKFEEGLRKKQLATSIKKIIIPMHRREMTVFI